MLTPRTSLARRAFLRRMAGWGTLVAAGMGCRRAPLFAMGALAPPQGFQKVAGSVTINSVPALVGMPVAAGDIVTTGPDGQAIFVIGRSVYLLRAGATLQISSEETTEASRVLTVLRILNGRLLAVFRGGHRRIVTATAVMGIRGSGVYVEAETTRTYICTCYGTNEIVASADPRQRETVKTAYHDAPRYVHAAGTPQLITAAPVIHHSDAELIMLEKIAYRQPPFLTAGETLKGY